MIRDEQCTHPNLHSFSASADKGAHHISNNGRTDSKPTPKEALRYCVSGVRARRTSLRATETKGLAHCHACARYILAGVTPMTSFGIESAVSRIGDDSSHHGPVPMSARAPWTGIKFRPEFSTSSPTGQCVLAVVLLRDGGIQSSGMTHVMSHYPYLSIRTNCLLHQAAQEVSPSFS